MFEGWSERPRQSSRQEHKAWRILLSRWENLILEGGQALRILLASRQLPGVPQWQRLKPYE